MFYSLDNQLKEEPKFGGLRFQESGRDCILSHGAANFLKETLQDRSDNYRLHICNDCDVTMPVNKSKNIAKCKNCYLSADKKNKNLKYSEIRGTLCNETIYSRT